MSLDEYVLVHQVSHPAVIRGHAEKLSFLLVVFLLSK